MIYGYLRVSTDKQTLENQRFEIQNFCRRQDICIDEWVMETVSGALSFEKRALGGLLRRLRRGDILIASEMSRFGRNLFQIMTFLHLCMQKEIQIWTIKDNYKLGTDIQSKVFAFAFGLVAEIERTLISQRTKEALRRLKAKGRPLGRRNENKNKIHVLDGKVNDVLPMHESGIPKTQIARVLGVSSKTIYNFFRDAGNCDLEQIPS